MKNSICIAYHLWVISNISTEKYKVCTFSFLIDFMSDNNYQKRKTCKTFSVSYLHVLWLCKFALLICTSSMLLTINTKPAKYFFPSVQKLIVPFLVIITLVKAVKQAKWSFHIYGWKVPYFSNISWLWKTFHKQLQNKTPLHK